MTYFSAHSLDEALTALNRPAKIVAGCTDFFPSLKSGKHPARILDVSQVDEMRGIQKWRVGWRIGGATTWTQIIEASLPPCFDGLKAAAREVGSIQIQNAGTVAGNICNASPAADGVPPLLTLKAIVEVASFKTTRLVELSKFMTDVRKVDLRPDEIVSGIWIPETDKRSTSSFLKLGSRRYLVISIAMVAVVCSVDDSDVVDMIRISVGACSPVAVRLNALESELTGMDVEALLREVPVRSEHLEQLSPIDDVRGSSSYRKDAVVELCRRSVRQALQEGMQHR